MNIKALGYVGIRARDTDAWRAFAAGVLGMHVRDTEDGLALRMDEKVHRFLIHSGDGSGASYFGWETDTGGQLDEAARNLEGAGLVVHRATSDDLRRRDVAQMVWTRDPLGNRVELYCGLSRAEQPFEPARPMSGFRTGALGLGHAVLAVPAIDRLLPFYRDVLGMKMSDYATAPFHAVFLHINERHHSLALLETGQAGLHHLMVEALSLDDVGKAYDAALEHGVVRVTLGRHTNDHILSFYAASPSGFMFEYGWGGRSVEDATWSVQELVHGPSIWGHERTWLSEEKRAEARGLRLQAAAAGLRAPVHVAPGEFDVAKEVAKHHGREDGQN